MFKRKLAVALATLLMAGTLAAQGAEWVTTGGGVRVKKIAFVSVNVYYITHQMRGTLPAKDAQAVLNADQDKRFILKMMRDVEAEKIVAAIREAYTRNGRGASIPQGNQLFSVLTGNLAKDETISISYNAANKTTTCTYKGRSASVAGVDFMKATWSIWFGSIDQPGLTTALLSRMP